MAKRHSSCFFLFLLLLLFSCNSVTCSESDTPLPQLFPSIHLAVIRTEFDSIDPPTTALPSPPPVTTGGAPGIVTVPGANPTNPPVTNPPPVTPPVTNPTVTPPVTNPTVTPPVTNPTVTPPVPVSTTPAASGGSGRWCIAKNGASQAAIQAGLDYACGIGGADCASIQQGSSCYEPVTLQNHASFAFNSYYQKNPAPTSCDFGGAAALTTTNPSTGTCVYPTSSSSSPSSSSTSPPSTSTPPTTQTPPVNPTSLPTPPATQTPPVNPASLPTPPATSSSGQTFPGSQYPPPAGFSLGNPDTTGLGAYASPPTASVSSNKLQPFIVTLVTVASSIFMFGL